MEARGSGLFREYMVHRRNRKLSAAPSIAASRVVGTGALHQSLRGSCHRPNGTDLSSAIMAAPAVATPATRASTTWSVYGRVAQTMLRRPQGMRGWPWGRIQRMNRKRCTRYYALSAPFAIHASATAWWRTVKAEW